MKVDKIAKPLFGLIKTADNINQNKLETNTKLSRMLERLDYDRPLMLKEKLDIIWKESDYSFHSSSSSNSPTPNKRPINLQKELKKMKLERMHINN